MTRSISSTVCYEKPLPLTDSPSNSLTHFVIILYLSFFAKSAGVSTMTPPLHSASSPLVSILLLTQSPSLPRSKFASSSFFVHSEWPYQKESAPNIGACVLRLGDGAQADAEGACWCKGGKDVLCVVPKGCTGVVVGRRVLMGTAEKVPGIVTAPCVLSSVSSFSIDDTLSREGWPQHECTHICWIEVHKHDLSTCPILCPVSIPSSLARPYRPVQEGLAYRALARTALADDEHSRSQSLVRLQVRGLLSYRVVGGQEGWRWQTGYSELLEC